MNPVKTVTYTYTYIHIYFRQLRPIEQTDSTKKDTGKSRARSYAYTDRPARNCTIRLWHL